MQIKFVLPALYLAYLAQIPTRFLNNNDRAPYNGRRPLYAPELNRPLTNKEYYFVRLCRQKNMTKAKIIELLVTNDLKNRLENDGAVIDKRELKRFVKRKLA